MYSLRAIQYALLEALSKTVERVGTPLYFLIPAAKRVLIRITLNI
jgi:hypothetical protein